MMKKITKAQRNSDIIALLTGEPVQFGTTIEDAVAHLEHENEMLSRKNSSTTRKPTKAQLENVEYKNQILAYLETCEDGVTASEVMKACGLSSNQKAAALLKSLQTEGKAIKEIVKGVSMFSLA